MNSKTHLLIGKDAYSISLAIKGFKDDLGAGELLDANYSHVNAEKITPGDLRLIVSASPFLAPKRLVVVFGLLERFEKQPRRVKKRGKKNLNTGEDISEKFARIIMDKPDSTELVIVAGNIAAGNPLLKILGKDIEKKTYPVLSGEGLSRWVVEQVKLNDGTITPDAARLLSRQVGSDLWAMSNEIEKLALFAAGQKIDSNTVAAMVSVTPEANIFHMIDAVVAGRSSAAELEMERLLSTGISPSHAISMLARQMRMIAIAQDMLERGSQTVDIRKRLGIKHDFVMQKVAQKARVFNISTIYNFYSQLVNAEMDIKTGKLEPELALSLLVEKLARIE